jgi:hypothetical protein
MASERHAGPDVRARIRRGEEHRPARPVGPQRRDEEQRADPVAQCVERRRVFAPERPDRQQARADREVRQDQGSGRPASERRQGRSGHRRQDRRDENAREAEGQRCRPVAQQQQAGDIGHEQEEGGAGDESSCKIHEMHVRPGRVAAARDRLGADAMDRCRFPDRGVQSNCGGCAAAFRWPIVGPRFSPGFGKRKKGGALLHRPFL